MQRLIVVALMASLPGPPVAAGDPPKKVKPAVVWTGTDSSQSEASFVRCLSEKQWRTTWKAHEQGGANAGRIAPSVDFDTYMILAVFQGVGSQNYGLFDFEVLDETDCLRVRYITGNYQTGGLPDSEADQRKLDTQSYAFIVLPKFAKPIVFEEAKDVRTRTGWQERGRIPQDARK